MDLTLTRVYLNDEEEILTAKISINPAEIDFYEEYVGTLFRAITRPVTTLYTYSGHTICILSKFETFKVKMDNFRANQKISSFYRSN
jgi:hypothetical protein